MTNDWSRIAFDGTKFNTAEECRRFERKTLTKLMKKDNRCPWFTSCEGVKVEDCNGTRKEVEACFGIVFDVKVTFT